ncbi:MAG: VCBS domain-containing protein, partial [Desulfovibrio sp.]|nr:VCBS domain-containing protein [Desulfovibrio sp.]
MSQASDSRIVRIGKPSARTAEAVEVASDIRVLSLDFDTSSATATRQGDSLVFSFADGSSVALRDFYTQYNASTLPEFVIGGENVAGEEFFAALNNPDLLPAAGPGGASGGGRYQEYSNADLADGLDTLGGLDWAMAAATAATEFGEDAAFAGTAAAAPNTPPLWGAASSASATENEIEANPQILRGALAASDADGDALTYGMGAGAATAFSDNNARGGISASDFGEFTLDPASGEWTFEPVTPEQNSAINSLAEGETLTLTFPVQASDGKGGVTTETVTVTITGTNDAPVWSSSDTDESAAEDQLEGSLNYTLSASLAASDADTGDTLTYGIGTIPATAASDNAARGSINASDFGEFSVQTNGEWTFEAKTDAQKAAINSLAEG